MHKHLFLLALLTTPLCLYADEVLLSHEIPSFGEHTPPSLLTGKELFAMAEPGDTARYSAMIAPVIVDIGFNALLRTKLLTERNGRNTALALLNWIGGTALLSWSTGKTVSSLQKKIESFTQLYNLSCHPNLARLLQTYDTSTLPSANIRDEFIRLQQSQFLLANDAQYQAQVFITDQLKTLAKSIYRLRTIGTALFSGTLAHLVSASCAYGWSDKKNAPTEEQSSTPGTEDS